MPGRLGLHLYLRADCKGRQWSSFEQEVEDRLRLLAAFLGDVLARARVRADSGRGWSSLFDARSGSGRGGQPAAKRARVEEAAKQELQR